MRPPTAAVEKVYHRHLRLLRAGRGGHDIADAIPVMKSRRFIGSPEPAPALADYTKENASNGMGSSRFAQQQSKAAYVSIGSRAAVKLTRLSRTVRAGPEAHCLGGGRNDE